MLLPADWTESFDIPGDMPDRSLRTFYAPDLADVQIALFSRRISPGGSALEKLQQLMSDPPRAIVEAEAIRLLSPVLGHMGDNQWRKPTFVESTATCELTGLETGSVNGRMVIVAQGTFLKSDGSPLNRCCDVFLFDASEESIIHEVYLLVPADYGEQIYSNCLQTFKSLLSTIQWK